MKVSTAAELGQAVRDGESRIEIEGDLAKKVIRIRSVGPVVWAVVFAAFVVALVIIVSPLAPGLVPIGGGASLVLGVGATTAAVGIIKAAGYAGALNTLRDGYEEVSRGSSRLVLERA